MKRLTLLMSCLFCLSYIQAQTFSLGDNVVQGTLGLGNGGVGGTYGFGMSASVEHCFFDDLINGDFSVGIGGFFGFASTTDDYSILGYNYSYNYTTIGLAGRGSFHWTGVDQLDLYAGVHLGGLIVSSEFEGTRQDGVTYASAETGGILASGFAGARYYFNDSFAVVGELGGGFSYMSAGVAFKF